MKDIRTPKKRLICISNPLSFNKRSRKNFHPSVVSSNHLAEVVRRYRISFDSLRLRRVESRTLTTAL